MGNGDEAAPEDKSPAQAQSGKYDQAFFLALAAKGKDEWNRWRRDPANKDVYATFKGIDFSEAPKDKVDFSGFEFGDGASFSGCKWRGVEDRGEEFRPGRACFARAVFGNGANFIGADFSREATFRGAAFGGWANFAGAAFCFKAGATFGGEALFMDVVFGDEANFVVSAFGSGARFDHVHFRGSGHPAAGALAVKPRACWLGPSCDG
jgi:uncharacterized protein YjbI with pentapeptide repeats